MDRYSRRYSRVFMPTYGAPVQDGRVQLGGIVARAYNNKSLDHLPEFTINLPNKHDYARFIPPDDPRVKAWIAANADKHAAFINCRNTMYALWDQFKGKTAVLVLAGPSAKGAAERLKPFRDNPDLKVFTLNKSAHAVPDADFFICLEQLCPPDYFAPVDPAKTTLLTTPAARGELADKWQGKNAYYCYMGDMRAENDPRFDHLPVIYSALATCVSALQIIYHMGFSNILVVGADFALGGPLESDDQAPCSAGVFYFDGTRWERHSEPKNGSYYNGCDPVLCWGVDDQQCATFPMMFRHMHAFACAMEMMHEAGVNVRNCSGQGLLDYNVAALEDSLNECLTAKEIAI